MTKSQPKRRTSSFEKLEDRHLCIVGGNTTNTTAYPFAVALMTNNYQFCGGSLLDSTHVLTAAHCTGVSNIQAVVNRTDLRTNAGEQVAVTGIQVHPRYNGHTLDNDVAILTLAKPVSQGTPIRTAKNDSLNKPGKSATVIGWGTLEYEGADSPVLRQVTVPIVSNAQANRSSSYNGLVTRNMLAAGSPGKDSCQGDSGGPLFGRNNSGELRQIGIVSWGRGCGLSNFPGIYTRVSNYYDWINIKLRERGAPNSGVGTTNPLARSSFDQESMFSLATTDDRDSNAFASTLSSDETRMSSNTSNSERGGAAWRDAVDQVLGMTELPSPCVTTQELDIQSERAVDEIWDLLTLEVESIASHPTLLAQR